MTEYDEYEQNIKKRDQLADQRIVELCNMPAVHFSVKELHYIMNPRMFANWASWETERIAEIYNKVKLNEFKNGLS